ncbi:MAG: hypothetical protein QOG78_3630 [Rhodospirillaceae bacterium]|jgi:hypothetical protein|nr:hypothetical protein [Rhodospirillaceae bacterium]
MAGATGPGVYKPGRPETSHVICLPSDAGEVARRAEGSGAA